MPEVTSLPKKRKSTKNQNLESMDLESRKSCRNIMNFFKTLEEMETKKISEKSGRNNCKGPVGSKIEYSYHIKINDPARREENPKKPEFQKLRSKKKLRD